MGTEVLGSWGTWEELLLGGAVLRHGTRDWDVVAAELRARTISQYTFTPEVCKAKYEDLQQRYSGSSAWFEELRKKRVAELKRALEQSENSIGSLESKLESLKAEKKDKKERDDCDDAHNNNNNESGGVRVVRVEQKLLERVESSTKETSSKDGLSAGSFTHETTRSKWSPCEQEMEDTKPEASHSCNGDEYEEKVSNVVVAVDRLAIRGSTVKKRRGKRKRKDCSRSSYNNNNNGKETSVGDSEFLLDSSSTGDVAVLSGCKENSTTNIINCGVEDQDQSTSFKKEGVEFFMQILDSVLENKVASAFRRRLDSQKRGRYKKMIRRHMDFDTVRSRISSKSIKSTMELFRDLLLLTNNALVFYSKTTREYKSALLLRDHVTNKLRSSILPTQQHNVSVIKIPAHNNNASVKPRSVRPGNRKIVAAKVDGGGSIISASRKSGGKLNSNNSPPSPSPSPLPESLALKKKGIGRPKRVGRGSAGQVPVMGVMGKRRVRAK